jgi:acetylornithine deacetylase/succinyl-diaminopimelate desuccinylase-like protein
VSTESSHDDRRAHVEHVLRGDALDALRDYVRIPNLSPAFDPEWAAHGHMDRAVAYLESWARSRAIDGMRVEVVRREGLTPVLQCDVPASGPGGGPDGGTSDEPGVLIYGHLDKQPAFTGWRDGLGAWEPVLEGDRLYGRGGADDGYALFAALTAIEALRGAGEPHRRCTVLVEASEESGSPHLPPYLADLAARVGPVGLVLALDSSASTWDRLWTTTSLRGDLHVGVRIDVLETGVHSGLGGGVVPSTLRALRSLLDRVEDAGTGAVLVPAMHTEIPDERIAQARAAAAVPGNDVLARFPWVAGARRPAVDPVDALLANAWSPCITCIGADGLPPAVEAGNVLPPFIDVTLDVRIPPRVDAHTARDALVAVLVADPPPGARVTVTVDDNIADGWDAPPTAPWLASSLDDASRAWFGAPAAAEGMGGTIPFMAMLGEHFPDAQIVVTGVLGPETNAHGPNEFLDLGYAAGVTGCVSDLIAAHARS